MKTFDTPHDAARWLQDHVRGALRADSRAIGAGDGFVAWPGAATDGRAHVAAALARGAVACLVEREGIEAFEDGFGAAPGDERIAAYAGLKAATGPVAAAFHLAPSAQLDVIAVTGTNGKTSTAWWLAQALSEARGIDAATIERMTCPIGIDGIDGKEPEVIAVAVVAPAYCG